MLKTMIVRIRRSSPAYIPLIELPETLGVSCVCMSYNNDGVSFVIDIIGAAKALAAINEYKKCMPESDPLVRFDLWEEEMRSILLTHIDLFISRFARNAVTVFPGDTVSVTFLDPKVEVVSNFQIGPKCEYLIIPEFFGTTGTHSLNPSKEPNKFVYKTNVHIRNAFINILNYFGGDYWVCNSEGSWTPWKE